MEGSYRAIRLKKRAFGNGAATQPWVYASAGIIILLLAIATALFIRLGKHAAVSDAVRIPSPSLFPTVTPDAQTAGLSIQVEVEPTGTPLILPVQAIRAEPRILIYHTHATEAYTQTEENAYTESGTYRTEDMSKSVVAVGERLKQILESEYGYVVIHDVSNHEPPKLSTAYSRSEETMRKLQKQYPTISLFIDLHRDAYGSSVSGSKDYVEIDGAQIARMMFVVGTGEGATGTGFAEMPDYESNFALASYMTSLLASINPKLIRDVRVKSGRYNQHVSDSCVLVEVGHNANTLEQALAAMPYLAEAIAGSMQNGAAGKAAPMDVAVWAPG